MKTKYIWSLIGACLGVYAALSHAELIARFEIKSFGPDTVGRIIVGTCAMIVMATVIGWKNMLSLYFSFCVAGSLISWAPEIRTALETDSFRMAEEGEKCLLFAASCAMLYGSLFWEKSIKDH